MAKDKFSGNATDHQDFNEPTPTAVDFLVVGIGASAGGVQALLRFLENTPQDPGMAFVIVLHLSPKHESRADEVLQHATKMPVVQVMEPTRIEKNHVYLLSPSTELAMIDGLLQAKKVDRPRGRPVAIDRFFRSLADAHKTRAVSVILSGFGSDGAVGIGRIKECGGITMVQSPDDAEYDEMPRSALATGMVDIILPVVDMPQKLIDLWDNARAIRLPRVDDEELLKTAIENDDAASLAEQSLQAILTVLQLRTGHDFHHYKRATVLRRIERRLQVNALADLPAYRRFLEDHTDETSALLKDMLIGVTNFFRDREVFDAIERDVMPKLFEDKSAQEPARAWIAGCSTGEEAYSLAMLLNEQVAETGFPRTIQLFATDIDEHAISVARAGTYPNSIRTDVSPMRLRHFFTKADARYVINKSIREQILFATHNILRDPPFSRLDLVSCRNLLIYLNRTVQRQVLQTFHFSLQEGGYLVLGNSESAEAAGDLFIPIDKKSRIYRAKKVLARARLAPSVVSGASVPPAVHFSDARPAANQIRSSLSSLHERLREQYAPPSVIIDREGEILNMSEHVGRFLRYASGDPSHNLLTLVHPDLLLELRIALFQALHQENAIVVRNARLSRDKSCFRVNVTARRIHDSVNGDVVMVAFDELEEIAETEESNTNEADHSPVVVHLENELQRTREQLQSTLEQSNLATEELKASNEEMQATNEEMRSTGEELETSKEELQSVNEELITVNHELQAKVEETAKANDDLQNLIVSTGIATIFVDRAMRIKRYTAPAVGLFHLIESDVGRPLLDLTHRLNYPELAEDAVAAFEALKVTQREVITNEGDWFLVRLLPYRTADDRIDGAVLTLIDITALHRAVAAAHASEERLKLAALSTDDYAIIVQDMDGVIVTWNKGAQRMFGYDENEVIGQPIDIIFLPEERAGGIPLSERQQASKFGRANDDRWHVRKNGEKIYCSGVVTRIDADSFKGFAKIARDITDMKSAESEQQLQLKLERAVRAQAETSNRLKDEFFAVLSHELKNPLNLIHVKAEVLARAPEAREITIVQEAADAIQRSVMGQAKIIDDLLDLSRVRTGKLALQFASIDIASALRTVAEASFADAKASGITLSIGSENEVVIQADPVRVEQMLWNLVRNALKFTPHGGRITLSSSTDGQFACVEVADTGQGIAPDFLPKIFDMFSQADGGERREHGGLGIGLSLVKQLAEMHGGRIEVESEGLGKGTRFRLWLPRKLPSSFQLPPSEPMDSTILKGLRVLVVDDSSESLEAFSMLLELEGAQVRAEPSAERGLAAATQADFDLVLSDIGMPAMDGYQFIANLRRLPGAATIPAIALTGFGRAQDAVRAFSSGFNGHISKPVSLQMLLDTIRPLLKFPDATEY